MHNRSRVADPGYPAHLAAVQPLGEDEDAVAVVGSELAGQLQAAQAAGVPRWLLIADPGMGFGKSMVQHLALIRRLNEVKVMAARGAVVVRCVAQGVHRQGACRCGRPTPAARSAAGRHAGRLRAGRRARRGYSACARCTGRGARRALCGEGNC